ncbi:type II toxin-antitoxin system HicB family antitoxin [Alkalihalophilus sp. As8PL]|uniref:Type II toxin-antitoxin system HicB family antitoxin n=2 Tax=Alkalihalophilus TaxID=2893060 RepID=A0AB39BQC3_9BACI|nr:type II toxin-antitoxin system HicB family antitoxin [Alkalihalophilus lindianensis]MDV2686395.1 type II toxin-antitoxin system HicB family antitoxin [Alkalihalophilus lindianensis]
MGEYQREPYRAEDFAWQIQRVPDWSGRTEIMIEIVGAEGCVSFGYTVKEAKKGLIEALMHWVRKYGELALPEANVGAQLIYLAPTMTKEEEDYINVELKKLQ